MRSFSIVQAWFFACLVVLIGEVQGVGDIQMCRYRKFGKDFRPIMKGYKMADDQLIASGSSNTTSVASSNEKSANAAVDLRSASRKPMRSGKRFKEGGSGYARPRNLLRSSLENQRFEQRGITGFNAFYPVVPALRPDLAVKYPVSHYEVHLDFGPKIFITGAGLVAYENETNPAALETTVRLGGEEFHKRVWAAAIEANKQFNTVNTIDPRGLVNAFYYLAYNSRQAYSLILTAMRSQMSVNAQDEDNVWLSPILNQHRYIPMNFRNANYSNGYWVTNFNQTHFDTIFNRQNFDGGCFTQACSNARWAQLWSTLVSFLRLPKNWKQWCKDMFLSYKVVAPTDFSTTPRFVVFWPDGGYDRVQVNQGQVTQSHEYVNRYYRLSNTSGQPIVEWDNANLDALFLMFEQCSETFNILMATNPQLAIMFDILGFSSDIEMDFTRDILAKTLLVDNSWDVSKLIYASAVPCAVFTNSSQSAITTYAGEPLQDRVALPQYWIRKDPCVKYTSSDTRQKVINIANIEYVDATTINEANMLLLYSHIAPLSEVYFRATNSGAALTDFQYVMQPLNHYNTIYYCANSVNGYHSVVTQHPVVGHELLESINSVVSVKPRRVAQATGFASPSSSDVQYYLESGALPILVDADNQIRSFEMFAMSDYQIPDLTALEAINDYLDHLSV